MKRSILFAEKFGFAERVLCTASEPFPVVLRRFLWNDYFRLAMQGGEQSPAFRPIALRIWADLMGKTVDDLGGTSLSQTKAWIRKSFDDSHWSQVFSIIEFTLPHMPYDEVPGSKKSELRHNINETLSDFCSPYRLIGDSFAPISDEEQVKEIEVALSIPLQPVKTHLESALRALRDTSPTGARDSIRESIHAVESACCLQTGDANDTLGKALNKLKGKIAIPEVLEQSLHKLYGFTSNADGVRHAIFDEPNLTLREARFMVVVCSAFVTYLWDLAIAAGLKSA
jgi:AbiJ N-terminal domain 4